VSDKKSEQRISDSYRDESYFGGESREQMMNELRATVERFYQRATREQIQEIKRVVQSLLAARGLLPEQASKKIN
jgi:Skp family chaperone for outer membrane proteins